MLKIGGRRLLSADPLCRLQRQSRHRRALRGDCLPFAVPLHPNVSEQIPAAALFANEFTLFVLTQCHDSGVAKRAHRDLVEIHGLCGIPAGPQVCNGFFLCVSLAIRAYATEIIRDQAVQRTAHGDEQDLEGPASRIRFHCGCPKGQVCLFHDGFGYRIPAAGFHDRQRGAFCGDRVLSYLLPGANFLWHIADLVVSFGVVTLLFALLFRYVPDERVTWKDVWIGAVATAVLFDVGKFLIGFYIGKSSVGSMFGAAGLVVVILAWLYYSSQLVFLGAEFTHVYAKHHGSMSIAGRERPAA
jgi:hypothetical protein